METQRELRLTSLTNTLPAIALLLFSWLALYLLLIVLTFALGAPWDTIRVQPPVGYWQRTLNDFFDFGIGAYLPTMIFFLANWLLYGVKVRTEGVYLASSALAIANLIALFAMFIVVLIASAFTPDAPAHLTPDDWEYWGDFRRQWPASLAALLCFMGVIIWQPKLVDIISKRSQEEESGQRRLDWLVGFLASMFVGGALIGWLLSLLKNLPI